MQCKYRLHEACNNNAGIHCCVAQVIGYDPPPTSISDLVIYYRRNVRIVWYPDLPSDHERSGENQ